MKKTFPLLILCSLILLSCAKEQKRLNFDLTVTDEATGQPLNATVVLKFYPHEGQSATEYITLGRTDASGRLEIDAKFDERMYSPEMQITADGDYGDPASILPDATLNISAGKEKRSYTVQIAPNYYALVNLRNINCHDETDSVWLSNDVYPNKACYTGCVDGLLASAATPWTNRTTKPTITYTVKVKRDGLVYDFERTFELAPADVTEVLIEY